MHEDEDEPRMCPIVEMALAAISLHPTPEQTRAMVEYVERVKTGSAWEMAELVLCHGASPEIIGLVLVNLFTGEPLPNDWRQLPDHLTSRVENVALQD